MGEVAEAYCIEQATQKTKKMAKAKTREKAEKQRLMEKENKRKQLKYIKQL